MSRNWVAMLAKEDGWPWAGLPPSSSLAVPDASWSVQLSLSYNCEPKGGAVPTLLIYGGRAHGTQRLVLDPQAEELPRAEPTPSEALARSEKEDGPGREATHIV